MDQVLQQLSTDCIFSASHNPQSNVKPEVFYKYLKPTLKKLYKKDPANWDKYLNQVLASYRVTPNLATADTPLFCLWQRFKLTTTSTFGTNATLPRWSRIWMTQPRSPSTSPSYCKENIRLEPLKECPENHGQRTDFFQTRQQGLL